MPTNGVIRHEIPSKRKMQPLKCVLFIKNKQTEDSIVWVTTITMNIYNYTYFVARALVGLTCKNSALPIPPAMTFHVRFWPRESLVQEPSIFKAIFYYINSSVVSVTHVLLLVVVCLMLLYVFVAVLRWCVARATSTTTHGMMQQVLSQSYRGDRGSR